MEKLLSLSKMGILEVNLEGIIQSADQGVFEVFDLDSVYNVKEEIKNKKIYGILTLEKPDKESLLSKIKGATQSLEKIEIDLKTLKSTKKRIQFNITMSGKNAVHILVIDNTEMKFSENILEQLNSMYKTLLAIAPIGILLVDSNGIIIEFNNYLAHMMGAKTPSEFIGKDIFSIIGLREINFTEEIKTVLQKAQPAAGDKKYMTPYGKTIFFNYIIVPVPLTKEEKKVSAFAIIEDRSNINER